MGARARRMVESELNTGGPAQQRDVLKARRAIADFVLEMAERNEIEINAPARATPCSNERAGPSLTGRAPSRD